MAGAWLLSIPAELSCSSPSPAPSCSPLHPAPVEASELTEWVGGGEGEGGWLFTLVKHSDFGKCFLSSLFWKNN